MKYKLIKEYPRSPKLGKIEDSNIGGITGWQGTIFYNAHPEFWEKVEELDYQILSFVSIAENSNHVPSKLLKNGKHQWINWNGSGEVSEEELLKKDYAIHSVKRLSDGEVFTIGEVLEFSSFGKNSLTIGKIEIVRNSIELTNKGYGTLFSEAKKVKQALFTTEDDVEIFEGMTVFFNVNTLFKIEEFQITNNKYPLLFLTDGSKQFSTKDKAKEYVLLNKPCLSIMEVAPIFGKMYLDNSHDVLTRNLEKLKSLVQAKL